MTLYSPRQVNLRLERPACLLSESGPTGTSAPCTRARRGSPGWSRNGPHSAPGATLCKTARPGSASARPARIYTTCWSKQAKKEGGKKEGEKEDETE